MARSKEFDREEALDAAIDVFREHGFAGTSATMLTEAMQIGRQSLYDTFGDKWGLYCSALQRYALAETEAHFKALTSGSTGLEGIRRMITRVVREAHKPCLGVSSICEFGNENEELTKLRDGAGRAIHVAIASRVREAQLDGEVSTTLDPDHAAAFLRANIAAIRIAARSGAGKEELRTLGRLALQALR